ncbi:MAG TPA: bifunctional riboflavin kinase/FAD synthetase [Candidatus Krumholzibacteria bacterium]|nr:bifunctional riboflavin kinase/FAD synthetase [Candidatus Krumholzibacteria bacterium]
MTPPRIAWNLDELRACAPAKTAVTIGVFDGVHRGHRAILDALVARRTAGAVDGVWVMTFDPHPVTVTHSREMPSILTTISERLELLARAPVDGIFVLHFDAETQRIEYRDFIQRYFLDAMDMRELVIGYDCHFGHKREGSPERVAEEGARRGFGVTVVPPVRIDAEVVSSTTIRKTLSAANLDRANNLLGHPYLVRGRVVHGQGRGRDLGFPTANVAVDEPAKLWPSTGVYAVRVGWRGWIYDGMMNVGRAPTMKRGHSDEIEVHIFDFDHHIYGEEISLWCEAFLRPEQKFPTITALIDQLAEDRRAARDALSTSE